VITAGSEGKLAGWLHPAILQNAFSIRSDICSIIINAADKWLAADRDFERLIFVSNRDRVRRKPGSCEEF